MKITAEMEDLEFLEFMEYRKEKDLFRKKENGILREMGGKLEDLAEKVLEVVGEVQTDENATTPRYVLKDDEEKVRDLIRTAAEVFS